MSGSTKMPIVVYAFHAEGYGGFDWAPDTVENRGILKGALIHDLTHLNYTTGTLVSLSVKIDPAEITDLLEGELQDAIEVGSIGHIIARYYAVTA